MFPVQLADILLPLLLSLPLCVIVLIMLFKKKIK